MPHKYRGDYNAYRREWRARQRAKLQGVAALPSHQTRSSAVPGPELVIGHLVPAVSSFPAQPQRMESPGVQCRVCGDTGYSSNSTRCAWCSLGRGKSASPFRASAPVPDADDPVSISEAVMYFAPVILPAVLVIGGLWLWSKLKASTAVPDSVTSSWKEWVIP